MAIRCIQFTHVKEIGTKAQQRAGRILNEDI